MGVLDGFTYKSKKPNPRKTVFVFPWILNGIRLFNIFKGVAQQKHIGFCFAVNGLGKSTK